jgi:2-polyprenyl-3-methyl-5-hydroxy-6-metoxy-1,4-benzoquinol methylase
VTVERQTAGLPPACICGSQRYERVFLYEKPPEGEVRFRFSASAGYRREVFRCHVCGHFRSVHAMSADALYAAEYVDASYGDQDGLRRTFQRINALAPAKSDNIGRVACVRAYAESRFAADRFAARPPSVLDVGSGLCVFLFRMKEHGWNCTAMDADPRQVRHAREVAGVQAVLGDFMTADPPGRFDLVTLNKVLEHVDDPVAMLVRARACLDAGGLVYLEVPDGESAMEEGPGREEFFIEHLHVFSAASTALLVARAGFRLQSLERLREPSTKFTLRAFLTDR